MAVESGTIVEVATHTLGDELTAAHAAGVTVLTVADCVDFDEDGGRLTIGAEVLDYLTIDDEASTITLATPLAAGYPAETRVELEPKAFEKFAQVMVGDYDQAVEAVVPHSLWDRIADGIRDGGFGEVVTMEAPGPEGGDFVITDVVGSAPLIDGSYLDPSVPLDPAIVPPAEPPPPVAPTTSPTPAATGGVRSVLVNLPAVFNESAIEAEVYVSTTTPVSIIPANLHGTTGATQYQFYDLPDGTLLTDLPEGTTIYVVARAVNEAGEAPASAESSATLRKIDQEDFAVTYLYAGTISVDQLTGGDFTLTQGTVTRLEARGVNGEVVGLAAVDGDNPNGFYSFGAPEVAGQQGPVRVHFPVDGKPNIVSGQSEFDELTTKSATLQGTTTIAPGGKVLLGGQVQAPRAVPSALPTWHTVAQDVSGLGEVSLVGLTKGHDGLWYSGADDKWVRGWDDAGNLDFGVNVGSGGLYTPLGGVVYASHHGGRYYLLVQKVSDGTWWLDIRDTSFAQIALTNSTIPNFNTGKAPALGWDHVNGYLLMAYWFTSGSSSMQVFAKSVSAAGVLTNQPTWFSPAGYSYDFDLGYVARVSTEYGDRYIFRRAGAGSPVGAFQVFTTTASPTRQTSEEWAPASSTATPGGWYDGTRFWSLAGNGKRFRYEGGDGRHMWTSGSAVREVKVTWRSNAGGYETTPSPKASVTMPKRARLSVTTPAIPTGANANYPDAARIYVGIGSGVANGSMNLEKTLTAPATAWSTDTTVAQESPTTHPPTVNSFPNADPSSWEATSGGAKLDSASNGSVGTGTFRDSVRAAVGGRFAFGVATATVAGGSGLATFSHTLGTTPTAVLITPETANAREFRVTAKASTTFECQFRDSAGGFAANGSVVTVAYVAFV